MDYYKKYLKYKKKYLQEKNKQLGPPGRRMVQRKVAYVPP